MNYTLFTSSHCKNSFREKRLLNLKIQDIFRPESGKRADQLNSVEASTSHNVNMTTKAAEELQTPVADAINNTRTEFEKFKAIPTMLKDGARDTLKAASSIITTPIAAVGNTAVNILSGTTKIATQLVTNPIGLALNVPRIAADGLRFSLRPPLIFADYLASLIGRPSKWVKDLRDISMKKIDSGSETVKNTCAAFRDKILSTIGLGDSGHGHAH